MRCPPSCPKGERCLWEVLRDRTNRRFARPDDDRQHEETDRKTCRDRGEVMERRHKNPVRKDRHQDRGHTRHHIGR